MTARAAIIRATACSAAHHGWRDLRLAVLSFPLMGRGVARCVGFDERAVTVPNGAPSVWPNHGCGGAVCSPASSAPSACRLAAEAPFITKISIALPGVEPRFLKP